MDGIHVIRDKDADEELPELTDITVVLDRSGSMESIAEDVIGGFNRFLEEQQACRGKATLTLVQFDHEYEVVYEARDIDDVPNLTWKSYVPRGSTALLDAIGRTIRETELRLRPQPQMRKPPDKVVFVIVTDGLENASREYKLDQVMRMIDGHHVKQHPEWAWLGEWEFVFLGANQDAIRAAAGLGIPTRSAMTYSADAGGTRAMFAAVSQTMCGYRAGDEWAFSDKDRTGAAGALGGPKEDTE